MKTPGGPLVSVLTRATTLRTLQLRSIFIFALLDLKRRQQGAGGAAFYALNGAGRELICVEHADCFGETNDDANGAEW